MEVMMKKYFFIILLLFAAGIFADEAGFNGMDAPWLKNEKFYKSDVYIKAHIISKDNSGISTLIWESWIKKGGNYTKVKITGNSTKETEKNVMKALFNNMMIIDNEKEKTTTLIFPSKKGYVVNSNDDKNGSSESKAYNTPSKEKKDNSANYITKRYFIKNEKIGKYMCKKYKVVSWYKNDPENKNTSFIWIYEPKKLTIKAENTDKSGTTSTYILDNFVSKTIPMSIFKAPAGYTKYENMMQLMMSNSGNSKKNKKSDNPMMQMFQQMQKEGNK